MPATMNSTLNRFRDSSSAKLCLLIAFCFVAVLFVVSTHATNKSQQRSGEEPQEHKELRSVGMDQKRVGGIGNTIYQKDDEVQEIVDHLKSELERKSNLKFKSIEVINYKTQLVAGTNFFVKARAETIDNEEKIIHLRIYRDIKKRLELTAHQLDKTMDDEITYFQ